MPHLLFNPAKPDLQFFINGISVPKRKGEEVSSGEGLLPIEVVDILGSALILRFPFDILFGISTVALDDFAIKGVPDEAKDYIFGHKIMLPDTKRVVVWARNEGKPSVAVYDRNVTQKLSTKREVYKQADVSIQFTRPFFD